LTTKGNPPFEKASCVIFLFFELFSVFIIGLAPVRSIDLHRTPAMDIYHAIKQSTNATERIRLLCLLEHAADAMDFQGIESIDVLLGVIADAIVAVQEDGPRVCSLAMAGLVRIMNIAGARGLFHLTGLDAVHVIMRAMQAYPSIQCLILGSFILCNLMTPFMSSDLTVLICLALLRASSQIDAPRARAGCIAVIHNLQWKMKSTNNVNWSVVLKLASRLQDKRSTVASVCVT
jgi:hypothetical protein